MAVHVVRGGDTLWRISSRYGVPISRIIDLNGLQSMNALVPGLALYIPSTTTRNPEITSLGFLVPTSENANLTTLYSLANKLTYLAVVAYSFTAEGYAYNEIKDNTVVGRSKQLNIIPLLMVRNFIRTDFSAELAGGVLANSTYRRNLVSSLVNITRQKGFGGVSIDFEFIPPPQRQQFVQFLKDLKKELGQLILHVNVHAKTKDIPSNRIIGAYDYGAIGQVADLVAVMTIDYGYPGGPPDPIAPLNWVEEIIKYSVTQINPSKLQIALALYGYDKPLSGKPTIALSSLAAQNQAISLDRPIQFDKTSQSPWYKYWQGSEERIVWFEDIRSYQEKYNLITAYKLNGTTFWQISLPSPQNWAYLENNFKVRK